MSARFRYVAADGREVEIATTDELVRAFTSGSLHADSLLYDAYGGGWAPARSHSALVEKVVADMTFTLADPAPEPTEDVVAKLLRERHAGGEFESSRRERTVPGEPRPEASARPVEEVSAPARPVRTEPSPYLQAALETEPPASEAPTGVLDTEGGAFDVPKAHEPRELPPPDLERAMAPSRWPGRGRGTVGMMGVVSGALGGLAITVFVFSLLGDGAASGSSGAPGQAVRDAAVAAGFGGPARTGASEVSLVERRAMEDMVAAMEQQQVVFQVDRVPSLWLEGIYLAEASRFPEVRSFWERYASYVEAMRAEEEQLFRQNLVARLRSEGVSEAQLSMRVARALRTFNADLVRREAVYDAMMELASAALDLHEFLADNENRISHAPASAGFSREPITEAIPDTRELGEEMDLALDRLFLALEATQGNRIAPRDEIPQALRRGLVSTGTAPMN
jgi:hypothetical protein